MPNTAVTPPDQRQDFFDLLQAIADGLRRDDPELQHARAPQRVPLRDILAAGTVAAGLPFLGRTPRSGRRERSVVGGARRAGAALGGGVAVRFGNAPALAELGLNLQELEGLTPREQTERIINRVFGASADENDQAFREAATIILLALLENNEDELDYHRLICDAAAEIVYRRALVEIHDQVIAGALTREDVKERERQIHDYIRDLIRGQPAMHPPDGFPSPAVCSQVMAEVTAIAIDILRSAQSTGEESA